MNFGVVVLALFIVCGALVGIGILAGNTPAPYLDTYGNTTKQATNFTQSNLTATAVPINNMAGGLVIIFGVLVLVVCVYFLYHAMQSGGRRYSGRY